MALIVALIAVILIYSSYRLSRYLWGNAIEPRTAMLYAYFGGILDTVTAACIVLAAYLAVS